MRIFNLSKVPNYNNYENENLRAIASRFRGSKEDTVFVTTSRICPECSKYNRRIFSLFGRYKAFPILPEFLTRSRCPICNVYIGYAHYFPGINGNLKKDIAYNRQPIRDNRSAQERAIWDNCTKESQENAKMETDYNWLIQNMPNIAPKSIGGYKRMCKANSKNYQKIIAQAKERGYII